MTIFTCRGDGEEELAQGSVTEEEAGGVDVSLSLNPPDFPGVVRQKTKSEATGIESVVAENRRLPLRLREIDTTANPDNHRLSLFEQTGCVGQCPAVSAAGPISHKSLSLHL